MDTIREHLKERYKKFMPNWLNYDSFNFDEEYANKYKMICKEISRHSKGDIADNVCSTYFGFIENINRKGENIYKNHDMWTEFIKWSYNKQNEHPKYVYDSLNTFATNLGTLISEKVSNISNNVETLNENSESLKNVLKLYYFSDGISDVIKEYNPIICNNIHEESKPHNVCNVLETFFVKYRDMLYPVIRTRGNVTSQNDPLYDRIRCSVSDIGGEKYTLTPVGKMIDTCVQRRKIRESREKTRRTAEKKSSKGEYTNSDYSEESY
ncbi:PIR Superfamily Protein [Plasmodium ovale curtisi]|uniref:PIR Superfamily Protein n=1 Tax=Plasmodium ovale curtisi TaxID=864141 RepID=A0A1A8X8Q7_PLAOA|nr:PIR Superfamily Protein [Plasmodium ovale curtisi]